MAFELANIIPMLDKKKKRGIKMKISKNRNMI
ncbi:hypothetical protein DJ87_5209 [Bacillus cereus]|nr:hypothetical protein DJ87_5209 [Bacillus cereus]